MNYQRNQNFPRTRIVCTIGPATGTKEIIRKLIKAGMSVARLNLAHGDASVHREYIKNLREVSVELEANIGILADLPGPKYRLGGMVAPIKLKKGQTLILSEDDELGTPEKVSVHPIGLRNDISPGTRININEGVVELEATEITDNSIICTVILPGPLEQRKSVTAPGFTSTLDYFTDETVAALETASKSDVDFVGLSYVRNVEDVRAVRAFLKERNVSPWLVAKIEVKQGVENIESVLAECEAVMVARGDLGVEMPLAEVPGVQKRVIAAANKAGKPAITATQMLESMISSPKPTRAEVTDVHNAILDGTDAIMLSAETSIGAYPVDSVALMREIALKAEEHLEYSTIARRRSPVIAVDDIIAKNSVKVAEGIKAKAITAFTETGNTAQRVAAFRPSVPIIALVQDMRALTKLSLVWGVNPVQAEKYSQPQEMFYKGSQIAMDMGYAGDGDHIVVVLGMPVGVHRNTNLIRVVKLPEPEWR